MKKKYIYVFLSHTFFCHVIIGSENLFQNGLIVIYLFFRKFLLRQAGSVPPLPFNFNFTSNVTKNFIHLSLTQKPTQFPCLRVSCSSLTSAITQLLTWHGSGDYWISGVSVPRVSHSWRTLFRFLWQRGSDYPKQNKEKRIPVFCRRLPSIPLSLASVSCFWVVWLLFALDILLGISLVSVG